MTIKRSFSFINILDRSGNLSLTNIILLATLINCLLSDTSFNSSLLFIMAAINYIHRRKEINTMAKESNIHIQTVIGELDNTKARLDDVSKQITALSIKSGISNFNGQ